MKVRNFISEMAVKNDAELIIESKESLEINLNQDQDFFYLHLFDENNFLFTIKADRRVDLDDYLFINDLKISNDFVKKIFNS